MDIHYTLIHYFHRKMKGVKQMKIDPNFIIFPEEKKKRSKKKSKQKTIFDFLDGIPDLEDSIDEKIEYREAKQKFKSKLLSMIQKMNDCGKHKKSKDYVLKAKGKHGGTEAEFIFQSSPLWNGKMNTLELTDPIFKYRFLTMLYDDVIRYLDDLVELEYSQQGRRLYEYEDKTRVIKKMQRCLILLQKKYISNEPIMKEMVQMEYYFSKKKPKKKEKLVNTLVDHLGIIMDNQTIGGKNQLDDYVIINDLIKLAYVAVTENPDISKTSAISSTVTFEDRNKLRLLIMKLGEDLIKYDEYGDRSILYQEFLYSKPRITTTYRDARHNKELREGVRALTFLEFLTNSKEVRKFIMKMT